MPIIRVVMVPEGGSFFLAPPCNALTLFNDDLLKEVADLQQADKICLALDPIRG